MLRTAISEMQSNVKVFLMNHIAVKVIYHGNRGRKKAQLHYLLYLSIVTSDIPFAFLTRLCVQTSGH
jgi:hypothetical protein